MADAILHAGAGQQAFDDFAKKILDTHTNAKQLQDSANKLAGQLFTVTGNATDARKEFTPSRSAACTRPRPRPMRCGTRSRHSSAPRSPRRQTRTSPLRRPRSRHGPGRKSGLGMAHRNRLAVEFPYCHVRADAGPADQEQDPAAKAAFEAWAWPDGKSGLGLTKKQADAPIPQLTTKLDRPSPTCRPARRSPSPSRAWVNSLSARQ